MTAGLTAESGPLGPLNLTALGPSEVFREVPFFQFPMDRTPGRTEVLVDVDWINYWIWHVKSERPFMRADDPAAFPFEYGTFLLDMEVQMLTLQVQHQATPRLRLDGTLPILAVSGGILDGFIEDFHSTFHLDQHRRNWWSRGAAAFFFVQRDGSRFEMTDRDLQGTYLGDVSAGAACLLHERNPAADLRVEVGAPTSTLDVLKSGGIRTTLQSTLTWGLGRWFGHHALGYTWFGGANDAYDLEPYRHRWSSLHTFEFRLSAEISLLLQGIWASPFARYPRLDDPVVEITLGMKKRIRAGVLVIGFVENLFYYDNSPDLSLHIAARIAGGRSPAR